LVLESWDEKGTTRTLSLHILDAVTARERYPDAEKLLGSAGGSRLILKYEQTNQPERISIGVAGEMSAADTSMRFVTARIAWSIASVYLTSVVGRTESDLEFFGRIEAAKRQSEVLPALQILEPRLERLSLLPLAGQSVIHGDIGLPRLVPMPFMGEGMRRVLSIVLAIANAPGGVVLIDEIENGLHYSVMKDVWKAIAVAARQMDVQVFATTHSLECVLHAHEAFSEGDVYDLRLYRLDRLNGEISVLDYDKQMIETALDTGLEMR
jgi:hypothetical protein